MRSPHPTRRRGFTLIELLVVIAIVAVLIGLLLPAVQKVRAAAARIGCQNNLKQIGLALHAYHDANDRFPAAYTAAGLTAGPGWGLAVLPYLEQEPLFRQVIANPPAWGAVQAVSPAGHPTRTPLRAFRCPADPGPDTNEQAGNFATSNYRAACGSNDEVFYRAGKDYGGVMYQNSRVRIADVTDGTHQTLVVGEGRVERTTRLVTGNAVQSGLWAGMTGTYDVPGVGAYVWIDNVMWFTGVNNFAPPSFVEATFNSNHPGRVNYLFADGSVRGLAADGDPAVRTLLGQRADGRAVAGDW